MILPFASCYSWTNHQNFQNPVNRLVPEKGWALPVALVVFFLCQKMVPCLVYSLFYPSHTRLKLDYVKRTKPTL